MQWFLGALAVMVAMGPAMADEADAWRRLEAQARGDFPRLLSIVEALPMRPQLRQTRSLAEQVRVLQKAGRFESLGVTPTQGEALVRAWFRR